MSNIAYVDHDNLAISLNNVENPPERYNLSILKKYLCRNGEEWEVRVYIAKERRVSPKRTTLDFDYYPYLKRQSRRDEKLTIRKCEKIHRPDRKDKDLVDNTIIVDIMKALYEDNVKKIALVTGDADYLPLVKKIHKKQKDLILIIPTSNSANLELQTEVWKHNGEVSVSIYEEIAHRYESLSSQIKRS